MGKYYTVTVKPVIPGNIQDNGNFADDDVLFDWTAFDIPRGTALLRNCTAIFRGENGLNQSGPTDHHALLFAKDSDKGVAPSTIGNIHSSAAGFGYFNHLIGSFILSGQPIDSLDYLGMISASGGLSDDTTPLVLEGQPDSGTNVGFDRLYVAGLHGVSSITNNELNFSTNAFTTGTIASDGTVQTITLDNLAGGTPNNLKKFDVGDVLTFQNADATIFTPPIKSLTNDTITFEEPITIEGNPTIANNIEVFNLNPITLIFGFEI